MSKIKVGLLGGGTVALSFLDLVQVHSLNIEVVALLVKNESKPRGVTRIPVTSSENEFFSLYDFDILVDASNAGNERWSVIEKTMLSKKPVVSANKKWIVDQFDAFHSLARLCEVPFLYEAATAAAIPVVKALNSYYKDLDIQGIKGILNGSCNYILSQMERGCTFQDALKEAQLKGFAEEDPSLDLSGEDARSKLLLLVYHGFGKKMNRNHISLQGIQNLREQDFKNAAQRGETIRLIAEARILKGEIKAEVRPRCIPKTSSLGQVKGALNAIEITTAFGCTESFTGQGAGGTPTAQALISDLFSALEGFDYQDTKAFLSDRSKCENIME